MARIPQQVGATVAEPGAIGAAFEPQRLDVNPDMFGAQQARSLGQVGQEITQLGVAWGQEQVRQKQIENETEAVNANNAYTEEAGKLHAQYAALRGQEAVDAYPQYQRDMQALRDRYMGGATNPAVRRQLNRSIGGQYSSYMGSAAGQNAQQVRIAGVQAQEGAGAVAITAGVNAGDNMDEVQRQLALGSLATQRAAQQAGLDPASTEARVSDWRGRYWAAVIANRAERDPLGAQRLFEENRANMDAQSQLRVQDFLRTPVEQRRADEIVRWATGGTGGVPGSGPRATAPGSPSNRQGGVPGPATVSDQVARAEGGTDAQGRPIQNRAGSSAFGPLQITRDTWNAYAERLGLERDVQGQTPPANRGDRATQERIWNAFQADARTSFGRDLTPREQYTAWFLGINGAKAMVMADPNADAYTLYRGVAGQRIADQAFQQNGRLLRSGMTAGQVVEAVGAYFDRYGGGGNPDGSAARGRDEQMRAALERAGDDPSLRNRVLSGLRQQWGIEDAMNQTDRARMDRRIDAIASALGAGVNQNIPESDIRRLYQPEQAQSILERLYVRQIEGDVTRSMQLSSPADISAMRADLANGSGPLSAQIRSRLGLTDDSGGVAADRQAEDTAARYQVAQALDRAYENRQRLLGSDPAQYALSDPAVREAAARDLSNPENMANYVASTLAAQARLGVPEEARRVLAVDMSRQEAGRLRGSDPSDGTAQNPDNAALRLQQMQRQYGAAWPRVFRDLVRDGQLPPEYQVLANIPTPVGQADYQRTLNAIRAAGGVEQFRRSVPSEAQRMIRDNIDTAMEPFRESAMSSQQTGAADLVRNIYDAVNNLSHYYALGGMDGREAVRRATDRVFNDKYVFTSTARIPREIDIVSENGQRVRQPLGEAPVMRAANFVQNGLRAEDLIVPPSSNPSLTEADRRENYLRNARRGNWVTNADDTGLILMGEWEMNGRVPIRRTDGSMIEIRFSQLPTVPVGTRPDGGRVNPGRTGAQRIEGWDDADPAEPPAAPTPPRTGRNAPRPAPTPPSPGPAAQPVAPDGAPDPAWPNGRRPRNEPAQRGRWIAE